MARRNPLVKRLKHIIEYTVLRFAGAVLICLPRRFLYPVAGFLGWLTFSVLRVRRRITVDNIRRALGDNIGGRTPEEVAAAAYRQIAITFIELLVFPSLAGRLHEFIDSTSSTVIRECQARGKGVILLMSHSGSWELLAASMAQLGFPFTVIAQAQANPYTNRFLNQVRTTSGVTTVGRGPAVRRLVQTLREGGMVGLATDQHAARGGLIMTFFGRPVYWARGGTELALRYHAPVVECYCERLRPGYYRLICREIPVMPEDTIESLTGRVIEGLEAFIRRCPDQYFWMHNRWKVSDALAAGMNTSQSATRGAPA